MGLFMVNKPRGAMTVGQDVLTIVASATKPLRVLMAKLAGNDSTAAPLEAVLGVSTGGTTPGGAITPQRSDGGSGAASFSVYTTWSVQPTMAAGNGLHRFAPDARGGIDPFIALPGGEIFVPVGGQLSLRCVTGTGIVVPNFQIEEIG